MYTMYREKMQNALERGSKPSRGILLPPDLLELFLECSRPLPEDSGGISWGD